MSGIAGGADDLDIGGADPDIVMGARPIDFDAALETGASSPPPGGGPDDLDMGGGAPPADFEAGGAPPADFEAGASGGGPEDLDIGARSFSRPGMFSISLPRTSLESSGLSADILRRCQHSSTGGEPYNYGCVL